MTNEEKFKRIGAFVCKDKNRTFASLVVKDGVAYATDGRIVVADKLEEPCEDIVTRDDGIKIPVDSILGFASHPDCACIWNSLDEDALKAKDDAFAEMFKSERIKNDREYSDRYKIVRCPSCGEDLWWDSWDEKLVDDPEPKDPVEILDVRLPIRIEFKHEHLDVNYAYLFLLRKLYGELLVSFKYVESNHANLMLFKTSDGKTKGVLMPLRECSELSLCGRIAVGEEVKE